MVGPVATFGGLASGIDTNSIVTQLVRLESIPITNLQSKQSDINSMSNRLQKIITGLKSLQDKAKALDTREDVLTSKATSSEEKVAKAVASGAAFAGNYNIEVSHLAQAERTYSDTFAARDQAGLFGTGTLTIQVGSSTAVNINVTASDTLESVANKITSSGAAVTAGVLFDGTQYRLQVGSTKTGLANAVTFTETGTSLGLDNPANELVHPQDATFQVDGVPMTRSSNSVADAIPGVTLTLTGTTAVGEHETITVERDNDALAKKIEDFVEQYNTISQAINTEFAFTGVAKTGDSLSGDSTLRGLQAALKSAGHGFDPVNGVYDDTNRLNAVGVEFTRDGSMQFDRAKLDAALARDPEAVTKALAGVKGTDSVGVMTRFTNLIDGYTRAGDGLLTVRINTYKSQISSIDTQIDTMQRRVDSYEATLRQQFSAMEEAVSRYQSQGSQVSGVLASLR